jgi:hypothetical protein
MNNSWSVFFGALGLIDRTDQEKSKLLQAGSFIRR